jgi:hypothetical protein
MAKLRISEYTVAGRCRPHAVSQVPLLTQPYIDFTDGMVHTSQPFSGDTRVIRISTDTDALICVGGPTPVATTNSDLLPAETWQYAWVNPGDSLSVLHG